MIKNAKGKGSKNERRSLAFLEKAGYAVTKSGGSLGAWDLIGIGPNDVVLVQCKTNRWVGLAEMAVLRGFVVPPNCRKLVHRWNDYAREPLVREV